MPVTVAAYSLDQAHSLLPVSPSATRVKLTTLSNAVDQRCRCHSRNHASSQPYGNQQPMYIGGWRLHTLAALHTATTSTGH